MTDLQRITPELSLIPLDQPLEGFTSFIGAWLYQGDCTLLVDVGPASTVPYLCKALKDLGVDHIDALLLTHIHIDHAGGAGDFVKCFPGTPVVCHPKAIPHLADPAKLWQGSLKTLQDTARAYGPIQSVPRDLLVSSQDFSDFGVRPIATPGHAVHHVSFLKDSILFAGEVGGVRIELPDNGTWLRPATPPRFVLEISTQSLDSMLETAYDIYCYGHFGAIMGNNAELLTSHKEQLLLWAQIIKEQMTLGDDDLETRCLQQLLENDPRLAVHEALPALVKKREQGFMINSIRGFIGYLRDNNSAA